MGLDYNPKDAANVWQKGEYPAVLVNVETTTSKPKPGGGGGNPMEVWTFEVWNGDKKQLLKQYVTIPAFTWRISDLAKALDRKSEFDAGTFQAENHIGSNVIAALVIEQQPGFEDKNVINRVKPVPLSQQFKRPAEKKDVAPPFDPNASESEFKEAEIPF